MNQAPNQAPNQLAEANPSNQQPSLPVVVEGVQKGEMMSLSLPRNKGDLVTNFRGDNQDDEVAVSRAMAPCDCNLDVYVDKVIKVVGVVLNMGEFESKAVPGEMEDKVYASMVLDDGTIVGTTGKALMGQLAYFVRNRPRGPFVPPLEMEVRRHKSTPPKNPYYSLRHIVRSGGAKGKAVKDAR